MDAQKGLNIAFISYWGMDEGLTHATVLPHIQILESFEHVQQVTLFLFEREMQDSASQEGDLYEKSRFIRIEASTFKGHFKVWKVFKKHHQQTPFDAVIARSSLAGIIGVWAQKRFKIDFYVESFEPHVDYMIDAGEWSKNGLKARVLSHYEKKIKKSAKELLPVTENYKRQLIKEGHNENRIHVMPCAVNLEKFRFSASDRKSIRAEFNIDQNATVGIYVGKFGGIYYDQKAFDIFKKAYQQFGSDFFLIILSPESKDKIQSRMEHVAFPQKKYCNMLVPADKVPRYCSAADFAFSLPKPTSSSRYVSPIKNAEYWANGLPIFMHEQIGDDAAIVQKNTTGCIFRDNEIEPSLIQLSKQLNAKDRKNPNNNNVIVAKKYRSFGQVENNYGRIVKNLINELT